MSKKIFVGPGVTDINNDITTIKRSDAGIDAFLWRLHELGLPKDRLIEILDKLIAYAEPTDNPTK